MAEPQESQESEQPHNHGEDYYPGLNGVPMNVGRELRRQWLAGQEITGWKINCAQCCCYFLQNERGYDLINGMPPRVEFGQEATTSCNVYVSSGGNRMVKTEHLQLPGICTVKNSRSYQFYGPAPSVLGRLQQPPDFQVRLESFPVDQLERQEELSGCHFSYMEAALLEVYRKGKDKPSLTGKCICPSPKEMEKLKVPDGGESKVEHLCTGVSGLSVK